MQISLTTEPMRHQNAAFEHLRKTRVGAAFMNMGTGKSLLAMMLAAWRASGGHIDKVWWATPCALRQNVVGEILKHSTSIEEDVHILTSRSTDAEIEAATWIVVGIETIGQSTAATLKLARHVNERSMMIVDESTFIKGPRTKRTDRLTKIGACCRYRLVMTGTPLTQGIVDLYAQMRFLSEKILGYASFWAFAQAHVNYRSHKVRSRYGGPSREVVTDHIIGYYDVEPIIQNVAPYAYQVRKEDCLDLPEKIQTAWRFDLTDDQKAAYEEAKRHYILDRDIDDFVGRGSSIALFRMFTALQKITAGVHRDEDDKLTPHDRVEIATMWARQVPSNEPIVIFTKFRDAGTQLCERIDQEFGEGASTIFDGRYPDHRKQRHLQAWRDGKHRFLLATQDSGGRGLTLTESCWALFYADGFKYDNRIQGEDRFHRIGQTRRPTYGSLIGTGSIDERIAENLESKGATLRDFQKRLQIEAKKTVKDRILEFVGG